MDVCDLLARAPTGVTTADLLLRRLQDREGHRVLPALEGLFPPSGMERALVYECQGHAAMSIACALIGPITHDHGWVGCVGARTINLQAAADLGVALQRIVLLDCGSSVSTEQYTQMLGTLVEGCEAVVVNAAQCTAAGGRSVVSRAKRNGTSMFLVGKHRFSVDVVISTHVTDWVFTDRLHSRLLTVSLHDQRTHRKASVQVSLPDASGAVSVIPRG